MLVVPTATVPIAKKTQHCPLLLVPYLGTLTTSYANWLCMFLLSESHTSVSPVSTNAKRGRQVGRDEGGGERELDRLRVGARREQWWREGGAERRIEEDLNDITPKPHVTPLYHVLPRKV